ncbi:MAG: (E)-4-hydroxy-3-methylbut-2-enyl-diphosphate synthase [Muribaculaceae bacterium]|nr:(E)-4-hydroxy-3-methylbut-2-enyl-diphosphate synthase [Muribaculaceae bacterium]
MMNYRRRKTVSVNIGGIPLGSDYPIRVQSMTNTSTDDIEASVAQCLRIAQAGAHYVRLTAQGVKEAENIGVIRQHLREQGCDVPLVADIHFNPKAAFAAAQVTDKVRINPGNFVDPARTFKSLEYTDEEYAAELERIREALIPFIALCRKHGTAVRLGVNHGSLSDRIMSRYGNTAAGMVESVMEFLRVFVAERFTDVVISMKASNVVVMVEAVRLLVATMDAEDMHFPLHLGVTEAGFGEDGRIKSAVGIGALLSEGLGDTIRVSLSEEPECEVPVAQKLVNYVTSREGLPPIDGEVSRRFNAITPERRATIPVGEVAGGKLQPVVIASCAPSRTTPQPDFYYSEAGAIDDEHRFIVPLKAYTGKANEYPLCTTLNELEQCGEARMKWFQMPADTAVEHLEPLRGRTDVALVVTPAHANVSASIEALLHRLVDADLRLPVVPRIAYADDDREWLQVKAGTDFGTLLLHGFSDGVWLEAPKAASAQEVVACEFALLQAARLRMSKTEFISCPGCGRTMFDLQTTVRRVQAATEHLTHLKIGVMGCIVNGPGEMADADYGYVGASRNRISLYKNKTCVEKNIPEEEAIEHLVALIKSEGDWRDPS